MLKLVSRAIATLGVSIVLLAPTLQTPVAQAQAPYPPVRIVIGTATVGNVAAGAVLLNNVSTSFVTNADLRCTITANWTPITSGAGDALGVNPAVLTQQQVPGPDGQLRLQPVYGWINLNVPAGRAQGPFIYVFNTNGQAGATWCYGRFIGTTFNVAVTSDIFVYNPPSGGAAGGGAAGGGAATGGAAGTGR